MCSHWTWVHLSGVNRQPRKVCDRRIVAWDRRRVNRLQRRCGQAFLVSENVSLGTVDRQDFLPYFWDIVFSYYLQKIGSYPTGDRSAELYLSFIVEIRSERNESDAIRSAVGSMR